jgi:hypothetical protein
MKETVSASSSVPVSILLLTDSLPLQDPDFCQQILLTTVSIYFKTVRCWHFNEKIHLVSSAADPNYFFSDTDPTNFFSDSDANLDSDTSKSFGFFRIRIRIRNTACKKNELNDFEGKGLRIKYLCSFSPRSDRTCCSSGILSQNILPLV